MGISGLLPLLAPVSKPVHIQEYAGKTVAVDGHCWLHKGAFSCAQELALKQPTTKYVTHFRKMIQMLRFYKVTPLVVFDGKSLPMKQETNQKRAERRKRAYEAGIQSLSMGRRRNAVACFQQSVSVTETMVQEVIKCLDQLGVKSIVAPYEADPQLAYLLKKGYAQAVVTEDSDLLAFGCSTVIFKLDQFGEGTRIHFKDIEKVMDIHPFDECALRRVCILSGCDYLSSLKGIGLKTAIALVRRSKDTTKIMRDLRFKSDIAGYAEQFPHAESAFLYQYVYDANSKHFVRLNELPKDFNQEYLRSLGSCPSPSGEVISKVYMNPKEIKMNLENLPPWLTLKKQDDSCETDAKKPDQGSSDEGASSQKPSGEGVSSQKPSGEGVSSQKPSGEGVSSQKASSEGLSSQKPLAKPPLPPGPLIQGAYSQKLLAKALLAQRALVDLPPNLEPQKSLVERYQMVVKQNALRAKQKKERKPAVLLVRGYSFFNQSLPSLTSSSSMSSNEETTEEASLSLPSTRVTQASSTSAPLTLAPSIPEFTFSGKRQRDSQEDLPSASRRRLLGVHTQATL